MRCLVTGASGFIGAPLVRELLARGHEVVALMQPGVDSQRLTGTLPRIRCIEASLDDRAVLEEEIRRAPVDAALHLAWSGVTAEFRNDVEQITFNVPHSLGLWKSLADTGCKFFIGLGSQAEYGPRSDVLREDTPTAPVTAYGHAKLAVGMLLQHLCAIGGMRFAWLRLLSAYGPEDDERHMVPVLIRTLLAGEKPKLTEGEQVWDYLYVDDVARALCAVLEQGADGIFNLGSGEPCLLRDFASKVRDCIDPSLPLGIGEVPYREDQVMFLQADITLLRAATGWKPEVSLSEGIQRTVEWHKQELARARG